MALDSIEELNKLETQIKETQELLKVKNDEGLQIEKLKKQKTILSLLALLFFIATLWAYFLKDINTKKSSLSNVDEENFAIIQKDSISFLKDYYANNINNTTNTADNSIDLVSKKVVFNVQIAAFQNYELSSPELKGTVANANIANQKLTIGNFLTYKEAINLSNKLKILGLKDCFITAQSYGNKIDLKKALKLSNE